MPKESERLYAERYELKESPVDKPPGKGWFFVSVTRHEPLASDGALGLRAVALWARDREAQ